ncbi:hypothetical protein B0I35DRAFT_505205, partial [Stachybotrys elegans]
FLLQKSIFIVPNNSPEKEARKLLHVGPSLLRSEATSKKRDISHRQAGSAAIRYPPLASDEPPDRYLAPPGGDPAWRRGSTARARWSIPGQSDHARTRAPTKLKRGEASPKPRLDPRATVTNLGSQLVKALMRCVLSQDLPGLGDGPAPLPSADQSKSRERNAELGCAFMVFSFLLFTPLEGLGTRNWNCQFVPVYGWAAALAPYAVTSLGI